MAVRPVHLGLVFLLFTGCCAPCQHRVCQGYGSAPAVCAGGGMASYHPGPLNWLWRLLGADRAYPCDGCGPRYWGDWGGEPAGCEPCDEFGRWSDGSPSIVVDGVRHGVIVKPSPGCQTCQSGTLQRTTPERVLAAKEKQSLGDRQSSGNVLR